MSAKPQRSDKRRHAAGAAALAIALLTASCADGGSEDRRGAGALDSARPIAALSTYESCDVLLDQLKAEAMDQVGPYGFGDLGAMPFDAPLAAEGTLRAGGDATVGDFEGAPSTAPLAEETPPTAVSGTNVQEAGIDEPDIVKADANRMIVVTNGRLVVIDLTGPEPTEAGRLDLPVGFDHELLVDGDRALVLTRDDGGPRPSDALIEEPGIDEPGIDEPGIDGTSIAPRFSAGTTVFELDLADPSDPQIVATLGFESGYVSARMQDGRARIVVSRSAPNLPFVYPAIVGTTGEALAEKTNRQVIEESTLDDWLPGWTLEADGNTRSGRVDDCDQVHVPAEITGFGLVSVLDVDLAVGLTEPAPVSVVGGGDTVYASADSLYVATERIETADGDDEGGDGEAGDTIVSSGDDDLVEFVPEPLDIRTSIHRFTNGAQEPVAYEASGEVEGRLLNQFSMSEHDDVLRVATTRGEAWTQDSSESFVTTLALEGDQLVEQGRVGDLGRGEQIFAVRFIGEVGYVVTFRQTDPLYVVDLRDPATPTVSGELKILGYSAYLHPIDDTHLLGVGQNADEDGSTSGTQVSLFDVSDPADPTRTAQYEVPGASSEVEWDHRAFTWWAPTGTAVLPIDQYDQGTYRTGALAVTVDTAGESVAEQGRITHDQSVRRSVVIGDALATIDSAGVTFSTLADLTNRTRLPL